MKHVSLLVITFLLFLLSCREQSCKDVLFDIDSYLHQNPDSALVNLSGISPEKLHGRETRALYALLLSLAYDKCSVPVTNDSLARMAVDYYGKRDKGRKAMLAWYSLARVQKYGPAPGEAIVSFAKAERLAQDLQDYHYLGLIEMNIADLYGRQNDTQEILRHDMLSADYFERADEPGNAVFPRYSVALAYNDLGEWCVCDSLLTSLENYALTKGNGYIYGLVQGAKGSIYAVRQTAPPEQIITYLRNGIKYAPRDFETSQGAQYFMIAFNLLGKQDSVERYHQLALDRATTARDTISLYGTLQRIAKQNGDYETANDYLEKAFKIENRTMKFRQSMIIANNLALYQKEKADLAQRITKERTWLMVALSALMVLFILWLLQRVHLHRLQVLEKDRIILEKEQRIQEDLAQSSEMMHEMEVLQYANDKVLKELGQSLASQMALVNNWANVYNDLSREDKDIDSDKKKKEDTIRLFCNSLEQLRNDQQWFTRLEDIVNLHKNQIMVLARNNAPPAGNKKSSWTEDDYRTLLLMYTGLPDKTIAFLLKVSEGGIRMRRLRFKAYFNLLESDEGAELARHLEKR